MFIHSSAGGDLGCFQFFTIMERCYKHSWRILLFLAHVPKNKLLGYRVGICLTLIETSKQFPKELCHFTFSPEVSQSCSTFLLSFDGIYLFYSIVCVVVSHCDFNEACGFNSMVNNDVEHIFICLLSIWIFSLLKCLFKFFHYCLNFCSFMVSLKSGTLNLPPLFSFFKIVLAILGPLNSHINFRMSLSISTKKNPNNNNNNNLLGF